VLCESARPLVHFKVGSSHCTKAGRQPWIILGRTYNSNPKFDVYPSTSVRGNHFRGHQENLGSCGGQAWVGLGNTVFETIDPWILIGSP